MQGLVTEIRAAGYTNPIVVDKWNQAWTVINDPLDNTYQGYHFYFNSWSVSGAISQMQTAQSKGIKIINTEIGADYNEYSSLHNIHSKRIKPIPITKRKHGHRQHSMDERKPKQHAKISTTRIRLPSVTTPTQPNPTTTPTPTQTPTNTSPTATPKPTQHLLQHPHQHRPQLPLRAIHQQAAAFTDNFESNSLNNWNKITKTYRETVSITSSNPCDGSYAAKFTTTGSSKDAKTLTYQRLLTLKL